VPVGPYIGGLLKVVHFYTADRDSAVNIQYLQAEDGWPFSLGNLNTMANDIAEAWKVSWPQFMANWASYAGCNLYDQSSNTGQMGSAPILQAGGGSSSVVSAQVCALVLWEEALRYRGGHPRNYLPSPGEQTFDNDLAFTTDFVDSAGSAIQDYLTAVSDLSIGDNAVHPVNLHAREVEEPGPPIVYKEPFTLPITGFAISPTPATQRKRLRKVSRRR
jgi:hypothetical protein